MSRRELNVEIDVQYDPGEGPVGLVAGWFELMSAVSSGDLRERILAEPVPPELPGAGSPPDVMPETGPRMYGVIEMRGHMLGEGGSVSLSHASWADMLAGLSALPRFVGLTLVEWSHDLTEQLHATHLSVELPPKSPGWLRCQAGISESLFLDEETGAAVQRAWLDGLWTFAFRSDPGFGQVSRADYFGATALESALPASVPREQREPSLSVGHCRTRLRGYEWLTIAPRELVPALGGVAFLAGTNAFEEVRPLPGGGVWLLATPDYRDYGDDDRERVFHTLGPVLPRGMPVPAWPWEPDAPIHAGVVCEDAANAMPRRWPKKPPPGPRPPAPVKHYGHPSDAEYDLFDPGTGVDLNALPDDAARAAFARERHALAHAAGKALADDGTGEPGRVDFFSPRGRLMEYHRCAALQWRLAADLFAGRTPVMRSNAGLHVAEAIRFDACAREVASSC